MIRLIEPAGGRAIRRVGLTCVSFGLLLLPGGNSISGHEHTLPAYMTSLAREPDSAGSAIAAPAETGRAGCRLTLRLTDRATGEPISGLARVRLPDGGALHLPELLSRGTSLPQNHAARPWHVVLDSATVTLPRRPLVIEAFSGLETELAGKVVDLSDRESCDVTLPLVRFHRAAEAGWHNGNTHLHLRSLTREGADEYLRSISRADELELVFVSYLTRAQADRSYISNSYTEEDLTRLSGHGVRFGFAEEHRHNFGPGGEGYGHVMFLNTRKLIEPVSIGPGIMGEGTDWPPLRRGIDQAREDGATVVWCHNTFGFEDVPDWMAGVLDAHNIFDGGSRGGYEDTFYRFLDVGLRVPFSTGTDWFIYDFSRVYVDIDDSLTVHAWLKGLEEGRTFITNGPMLDLEVAGRGPGDVIRLARPSEVEVVGRVVGRHDFRTIELVHNGRVVASSKSTPVDGHFEGKLVFRVTVSEPGWVALRVRSEEKNELGGPLFGHTSAVYFELAGQAIFRREVAEGLIAEMREAMEEIQEQAVFADDSEREDVLNVYREGIATLTRRLAP